MSDDNRLRLPAHLEIRPNEFLSIEEVERRPELLEQLVKLAIKELDEWHGRYQDFFRYIGSKPAGRSLPELSALIDAGATIALLLRTAKTIGRRKK
jgi:hypothetical protein